MINEAKKQSFDIIIRETDKVVRVRKLSTIYKDS